MSKLYLVPRFFGATDEGLTEEVVRILEAAGARLEESAGEGRYTLTLSPTAVGVLRRGARAEGNRRRITRNESLIRMSRDLTGSVHEFQTNLLRLLRDRAPLSSVGREVPPPEEAPPERFFRMQETFSSCLGTLTDNVARSRRLRDAARSTRLASERLRVEAGRLRASAF